MLEYEVAYARDHEDLPARVCSTVSTGEGPDMVNDLGIEHNLSSGPAYREGLTELF
jgi:hypothetical protein